MKDELVLCFRRSDIPNDWLGRETALGLGKEALANLPIENAVFAPRSEAETDHGMKQLIPYCLLMDSAGCLACYPRAGSESRLHGLWSLGVGGHVNSGDNTGDIPSTLRGGLERELREELPGISEDDLAAASFIGVINEELTDVGMVHLGLVYVVPVRGKKPDPGPELQGLRWVARSELQGYNLELWSKLAHALPAR